MKFVQNYLSVELVFLPCVSIPSYFIFIDEPYVYNGLA